MSMQKISIIMLITSLLALAACSKKGEMSASESAEPKENESAIQNENFHFQPLLDDYAPHKKITTFILHTKLLIPGGMPWHLE